ncbi:hypothetical protein N7470_002479 [Penicillium chermesinum]|nr:hypothetical protein N7470_002479 [Penicillium chermesinum]
MPTQFLSLPGEIRNQVYRHALVRQETIGLQYGKCTARGIIPNLLCTSRRIHREALPFLYGENRFALLALNRVMAGEIARFLDQIGPRNGRFIESVQICHPIFRNLGDDAKLDENCVQLLSRLQRQCPNLKTLIMCPKSTDFVIRLQLAPLVPVNPSYITESLLSFDGRLKAIPSLEEIIVQVYQDTPLLNFLRGMEPRGWRIDVLDAVSRHSDDELQDNVFGRIAPSPLRRS